MEFRTQARIEHSQRRGSRECIVSLRLLLRDPQAGLEFDLTPLLSSFHQKKRRPNNTGEKIIRASKVLIESRCGPSSRTPCGSMETIPAFESNTTSSL